MKNIHVIPASQPSRLFIDSKNNTCITDIAMKSGNNQNIYITNDEEIKEGDCVYNIAQKTIFKADKSFLRLIAGTLLTNKKIILTTDQDLIKDGVQAIDDEFLEWFVENPSCENIEVEKVIGRYVDYGGNVYSPISYKRIIPKQGIDMSKYTIGIDPYDKQETLEEAIYKTFKSKEYSNVDLNPNAYGFMLAGAQEGAKWQKERMYSEEEVKKIIKLSCEEGMLIQRTINDKVKIPHSRIKDFTIKMFEQFKNK